MSKLPLIVSRQLYKHPIMNIKNYNIVGTYNLLYNASLMAECGLGYVLCLSDIINTTGKSKLCFVSLSTQKISKLNIIWKKQSIYSKPVLKLIDYLKNAIF